MINPAGIHVIEVKNFSGWIFGNPYDKYWTQTLIGKQGSCHKHQFFNPLRQNYGHVQALKQNLSFIFDGLSFYRVVGFSDHCEFRTKLSTTNEPVVYMRELAKTVAEIDLEHNACLDRDEIELIYQFWKLLENPSPGHKEAHATYVERFNTFHHNAA